MLKTLVTGIVVLVAVEHLWFFLGCVVVAGVFGALSVSRRIFWIQALPALLGLGLAWLG